MLGFGTIFTTRPCPKITFSISYTQSVKFH